jgi:uncharacterized membrane protein
MSGLRRVALALAFGAGSGAALADISICNQTAGTITLAAGYRGEDGQYHSVGWYSAKPGLCTSMIYQPLADPYLFYRVDSPDFKGDGYAFCTEPDYFEITGDGDCEARGFVTQDFRMVDLGAARTNAVVNIGAGWVPMAQADLPVIDLSRPFTPVPPPATQPQPQPGGAPDGSVLASGLVEGANGQPFTLDGVFQGCDVADGTAYCAFHAEGWKFFAWDGGPNPTDFLMQLAEIPMTTAITVSGDVISEGDISAEVAIREVRLHDADPLAGLRVAIQGDWVSEDDPLYLMTVFGMEAFESYEGEATGTRFLRIEHDCPESAGTGPVLMTTTVPGFETQCFLIQDGLPDRLVLALAGQGGFVSFRRPE